MKNRLRKWMKGKYLEGMDNTDEVAKNVYPVDFFLPHMIKHRPFIRISIFLLSCPIQSASCERLFKDFAFFHTKARNRLSDHIRKPLTMIKHDIIRKYRTDNVHNNRKQKGNKNRMVVSREYNRLDDIVEDENEEESDKDGEGVDRGDAAAATLLDMLVDEKGNYSSYEDKSDEGITTCGRLVYEIEAAADLHVEGHTDKAALSLWRSGLDSVIPMDDENLYHQRESAGGCSHATTEGSDIGESNNDEPEDDEPEIFDPQNLDPLTDHNIPTFPQENRQYFLSIINVRTDKVFLNTILDCTEVDVPTIDHVLFSK